MLIFLKVFVNLTREITFFRLKAPYKIPLEESELLVFWHRTLSYSSFNILFCSIFIFCLANRDPTTHYLATRFRLEFQSTLQVFIILVNAQLNLLSVSGTAPCFQTASLFNPKWGISCSYWKFSGDTEYAIIWINHRCQHFQGFNVTNIAPRDLRQ